MPLHVSSTVVLIIRRSKLYYTASGIITPVGAKYRCDDTRLACIKHALSHNLTVFKLTVPPCRGSFLPPEPPAELSVVSPVCKVNQM